MILEGRTGLIVTADGSANPLRQDKTGALVTTWGHGAYQEAVIRGNVYAAGTAVTGVAPGTSIGTTAAYTLFNPKNSGRNLVVLLASMGYISGTLGAGTVFYVANVNPAAADVSGTAIVPVNLLLGGARGVALPFTTATLPTTPTVVRPAWSLTALLASTAVAPYVIKDALDGEMVIAPGCALSLEGVTAAGSTPLVAFGMVWEEVPV